MSLQSSRTLVLGIVVAAWVGSGGLAQADRVHLVDGAVIEGKVTRHGGKVVVELE